MSEHTSDNSGAAGSASFGRDRVRGVTAARVIDGSAGAG